MTTVNVDGVDELRAWAKKVAESRLKRLSAMTEEAEQLAAEERAAAQAYAIAKQAVADQLANLEHERQQLDPQPTPPAVIIDSDDESATVPTVTPPPEATVPTVTPPPATRTGLLRRIVRRVSALWAVIAGVVTFGIVLVIWGQLSEHAFGSQRWATSGWIGFTISLLMALAVGLLVADGIRNHNENRS